MSTNKNATALNASVNKETYDFVEAAVKELGLPVTKSGFSAFTIQTFAKEAAKMKREISEFCQKREDRKNKVVEIIKENKQKREENSEKDEILQEIRKMLQPVINETLATRDELQKLKKDLGA